MRVPFTYCLSLLLSLSLTLPGACASRPDSTSRRVRTFEKHTLVYKGEKMSGLGFVYANLDSRNSEYLLLVNNLDAGGVLFRATPQFSCAYSDNAAIGARIVYNNASLDLGNVDLNLLSKDLGVTLSDSALGWTSFGGYVFHRNFIGLEKSGTAGFFCEFRLGYTHSRLDFGSGNCNTVNQGKLAFAPGFLLYVLPFVSVESSIALADLTCTGATSFDGEVKDGSRSRFSAGVGLKLIDCHFGVAYHF